MTSGNEAKGQTVAVFAMKSRLGVGHQRVGGFSRVVETVRTELRPLSYIEPCWGRAASGEGRAGCRSLVSKAPSALVTRVEGPN